ncbi:tetratricopeptide repeat protein [Dactylosporangium sp. NPDC049525]|uniref:tetratricopeptide repeat protein n=1 Tax=Dactylosporangium sp. NPDC049525 TaxID=3154730 RepID=UPI00342B2117
MPSATPAMEPEPLRVVDRGDFTRELGLLRDSAGLTVRDVAARSGVPASTLGGYFAGTHLPGRGAVEQFKKVLLTCGVTDRHAIGQWLLALRRARRGTAGAPPAVPAPAYPDDPANAAPPGPDTVAVSTRAPTDRLARQPDIRGRDALLTVLARTLQQPHPPDVPVHVHVLHGLGGCGKSTVALAVARLAERLGVQVWWASAGDPGVFLTSMHAIAVDLGATPDQLRVGSLPDQVWRLLANRTLPWLLVIDDADDPRRTLSIPGAQVSDGNGWVRAVTAPYGAVIVTTRDGGAQTWSAGDPPWFTLHPVQVLDPDDGALVLQELAGPDAGSAASARRLSQRLGGLPLALGIVGRYLGETAAMPAGFTAVKEVRTFEDYRAALDEGNRRRLLDDNLAGAGPADRRNREVVGLTWELSLDLLAARGARYARPLLRLLSCFRPADVPLGLLRADIMARVAPFTGITARQLWRTVCDLLDIGLLDRHRDPADDTAADALVLHPLVRDASRVHHDVDGNPDTYLELLVELLHAAVRDLDPKHPSSWTTWSAVAEHCGAPLDLIHDRRIEPPGPAPDVLEPALLAVRYLRASGLLHRAEGQARALVAQGGAVVGRDHPTVLALRHELSRVLYDAGEYNQAKREFHKVLEAQRRTLGPHHPDTMTTAHYLARVLRDHGQLGDAEHLFQEVLASRRQVLGDTHPDTLTSFNNVADLARGLGRLDDAERLLNQVLEARRRQLGDDHPATLVTLFHLAMVSNDRGDLEAAEDQLRALATTGARVLGAEHPRTLSALQALADVRHARADLPEAMRLTRDVLDRRTRTIGPQHPATLASHRRLALIQHDLGDVESARTTLQWVLATSRRMLGQHHPATARVAADLDRLEPAR